jgi:hypothetical protein
VTALAEHSDGTFELALNKLVDDVGRVAKDVYSGHLDHDVPDAGLDGVKGDRGVSIRQGQAQSERLVAQRRIAQLGVGEIETVLAGPAIEHCLLKRPEYVQIAQVGRQHADRQDHQRTKVLVFGVLGSSGWKLVDSDNRRDRSTTGRFVVFAIVRYGGPAGRMSEIWSTAWSSSSWLGGHVDDSVVGEIVVGGTVVVLVDSGTVSDVLGADAVEVEVTR